MANFELGKRERLRQGKSIEVSPGVHGRLNTKDRTLDLSTGEKLELTPADQRELFPASEEQRKLSQEKEKIERQIKSEPLGEFQHQFSQAGIVGSIKNWGEKFLNSENDYKRMRQAQQEVSERISEESPWTSGAATAASFIPDIAATGGMSAVKAAPLLTGIHAGPRVLEEPGQVAGEALMSAGAGFLIDKGAKFLNTAAARRGQARALPGEQQAVRERNIAGKTATAEENLVQKQAHQKLAERTSNENAALLHQHNLTLNERQNNMIKAQNEYNATIAANKSEITQLKNEWELAKVQRSGDAATKKAEYEAAKAATEQQNKALKENHTLAEKQYQDALKNVPEMQKAAQAEYSKGVLENVKEIEKSFPKGTRISGDQFGIQDFIDESINASGLAATKEGTQVSRLLKSLFPENELMTAQDISKRYKAIEDAILRSPPEGQTILNDFKGYLGKKLPSILEDNIAYTKIMPKLSKQIENQINPIIKEVIVAKYGQEATQDIVKKKAVVNLNALLRQITAKDFIKRLQSGELAQTLKNGLLTPEDFLTQMSAKQAKKVSQEATFPILFAQATKQSEDFARLIEQKINTTLAQAEIKAMPSGQESAKKLGKFIRKTQGIAETVEPPMAPVMPELTVPPPMPGEIPPVLPPQYPNAPIPPKIPAEPIKPPLYGKPTEPIPKTFTPEPEPVLPAPEGAAERTGDFLEKNLLSGKGLVNNPLAKLAGLKYVLGKGALPVEAAYLGMKGLTSPGTGGQIARMTFKQGGVQAIVQMAEKYPSYNNGVLEDPQERRSLTKEIENDAEIPIEQKAVLQSKVNRGKSLTDKL